MSNANHPAAVIAFTELEEAFFRAGELMSETHPPADGAGLELDRPPWRPWRWLLARLRLDARRFRAPPLGR